MAERSFVSEIEDLRKGEGDVFTGEGILAITKALLECGVGYVGGYQGAPISHLMDVLADAEELMSELGVRFEANASEAAAAAMLAASVHYPIRGAVTFEGPVGVNVASDALANLCSSGVNGAAYILGLGTRLAYSGVKVWTPCAVTGPRGLNAANIDLLTHLSKMSGYKVRQANFQKETVTLIAGDQKLEGNLTPKSSGNLGPYEWRGQAIS